MASAFQNRLVGTIIVIALAVIFLPELLDGEKHRKQDRFESFPQPPTMQQLRPAADFPIADVERAVAKQIDIVEDVAVDESGEIAPTPDAATLPMAAATTQPLPLQPPISAGWVVQLGSFRHQKNVNVLLQKLERAGYRTFTRAIQTSSGKLTKVFVGPDIDRQALKQAVPHLRELTGLQGKLTPFAIN